MQPIATPHAPTPLGHYEQAQVSGGFIFASIQLPVTPGETPHALVEASMAAQAEQLLRNLGAILEAAGAGVDDIVRLTFYLTDMAEWDAANAACAAFFGAHKPARGVLSVPALHMGYRIAADFVAERPSG